MAPRTDILFITHLQPPRDTGTSDVYGPLRMQIAGMPATFPVLRILAAGGDAQPALTQMAGRMAALGPPPVLTPFYIKDYMGRRGIRVAEQPCLDPDPARWAGVLEGGVGVIALSTSWLPGGGGAAITRRAAAAVRKLAPGVPVVAGGVGVRKGMRARRLMAEGGLDGLGRQELVDEFLLVDAAADRDLDAVVVSEGGEETLAGIALRARDGRDFRDLPNLAIPDAGGYRFTEPRAESSDVDGELVDWSHHTERIGGFEAPVRTAVGCPFRCEFCDFTGLYALRVRSVESIVAELRTLATSLPAPRRVFLADDNVAATPKHLLRLTDALIAAKLDLAWRGFMRADAIDADTAARLRESGCRECLLGIESGDGQVLRNMNKRLDPERALRAVRLLDAEGISTQCTFLVGFPGETAASVERTAELISAMPSGDRARAMHRYYLFRFQVMPLCGAASPSQRERWQLRGNGERWSHSTMNSEEACAAVRTLFQNVRGPSHMYLEMAPSDWPVAATRRVAETRDALRKECLRGTLAEAEAGARLLRVVAEAERGAKPAQG